MHAYHYPDSLEPDRSSVWGGAKHGAWHMVKCSVGICWKSNPESLRKTSKLGACKFWACQDRKVVHEHPVWTTREGESPAHQPFPHNTNEISWQTHRTLSSWTTVWCFTQAFVCLPLTVASYPSFHPHSNAVSPSSPSLPLCRSGSQDHFLIHTTSDCEQDDSQPSPLNLRLSHPLLNQPCTERVGNKFCQ